MFRFTSLGILVAALFLLLGPGCGNSASTMSTNICSANNSNGARKIRNGDLDSACQYTNVLALKILTHDNREADCSGVLIDPSVVLTAAHCFADPQIAPVKGAAVQAGANLIRVTRQVVYPTYKPNDSNSYGNDLAVIFLQTPIDVPIAQIATGVPQVGANVVAVGYGLDGRGSDGNGNLGRLLLGQLHILGGLGTGKPDTNYPDSLVAAAATQKSQETCEGDSGGPLFYQNTVVGILSGGDVTNNRGACVDSSNSVYTPVARFSAWIKQQIGTR